ncbi:hypothetical protein ACXU4B_10705 [Dyella soli]|uniref:hypothetical protein n=1 Tax=Dyella soli TaxID=522319 RepID=UPI001F0E0D5F|nr:hypothetical protein [Dyella soli]
MSNHQKVAIATGAYQGIGAGLVKAFRERNYRVIATSRPIKPSGDPDVIAVAGGTAHRAVANRDCERATQPMAAGELPNPEAQRGLSLCQ